MKLLLHQSAVGPVEGIVATPGGTILLHGQEGIGKFTVAMEIARRLNCLGCKDGSCHACQMVTSGNHPDVVVLKEDEKGKIGIDAVHQLQHQLNYRQYEAQGKRVVIISGADKLTVPAANALLKTIEEPPNGATVILTALSPVSVLETIASRSRPVYLPPVAEAEIINYLKSRAETINIDQAVALSSGAVGKAITYSEDEEAFNKQLEIDAKAKELVAADSLFDRLQLAGSIAQKGIELRVAVDSACRHLRRLSRQGSTADHYLTAAENLRRRLDANVTPRAAFEAMAVELPC